MPIVDWNTGGGEGENRQKHWRSWGDEEVKVRDWAGREVAGKR